MAITSFDGNYAWLSNFYPCFVTFEGIIYKSVEHAYQAAKTLNIYEREEIWAAKNPGRAKRLGQKAALRSDWDDVKVDIMRNI